MTGATRTGDPGGARRGAALAVALLGGLLAAVLACPGAAGAQAPTASWWRLSSTAAPTHLPAHGEAQILVTASNVGDGEVNASKEEAVLTDILPAGIKPESVEALGWLGQLIGPECMLSSSTVACPLKKNLLPYEQLFMRITVNMEGPTETPLVNTVSVRGGETPSPPPLRKTLKLERVDGEQTPFGVETYELTPEYGGGEGEGEAGSIDTQAGSHPFQLTQTLDLNQTLAYYNNGLPGFYPTAPALARNLHFKLPPGLVGDPSAVPPCSNTDFSTVVSLAEDLCPPGTVVGVATVLVNDPIVFNLLPVTVPVFNLTPEKSEPARFGFEVKHVPIVIKTHVPTGGEYGVEVSVENASQAAQVLSSQVTLWGVPGDPRHDDARGWGCVGRTEHPEHECEPTAHEQPPTAFLTLPTNCEKVPVTGMSGESWSTGDGQAAQTIVEGEPGTIYPFPSTMTGCDVLPFDPKIGVQPETKQGSTPTGLNVNVEVPQAATLSGEAPVAEADVKTTTVALPEGLDLSPSAANGLTVCPALAFGFEGSPETEQTRNLAFTETPPVCPDASKVGTVTIESPLLEGQQVTGSVYLAEQNTNPFKPPLALYLVAEDPTAGVLVKLAGTITPTASGQVLSTFENTPQLPFNDLRLHFFGGERGSVSTPPKCGSYTAASTFTAWSGTVQQPASDPPFQIASGPGGAPCADPLPFSPSFTAGAANMQAGAYTPFTLTLGHADSDQPLERIDMHLPSGIAALISQVTLCTEAQALTDTCPAASLIGHTTAVAGLGGEPVTLGGQLYLTGTLKATPTHGAAPFGLLAVTHAAAGPFDLGNVNVLSTLNIDPSTAAVTVQSEPIPQLIQGVPAQLKQLQVTVERPGNAPFEFNPTNCDPFAIAGTLTGYEGASLGVSYPFQVQNCAGLPFHPTLEAYTQGHASKANGTSLDVKVTSQGVGVANIQKVDLQLPKALPSRLTTIQKACVAAVFESNPAACDEGSVIGHATIQTPVFSNPLSGPAYLVSHGGAAFPDVEFVLTGEGVEIVLDGKTDIKSGITYSKFESAPDAPFTTFETVLPAGPHSALTANVAEKKHYNLCGEKLTMPTTITAQNGKTIEQTTKIAVQGCNAVKSSRAKKLTRKQKLAKALKTCRKHYKHSHNRRAACEKKARKLYAAKKAAHETTHGQSGKRT